MLSNDEAVLAVVSGLVESGGLGEGKVRQRKVGQGKVWDRGKAVMAVVSGLVESGGLGQGKVRQGKVRQGKVLIVWVSAVERWGKAIPHPASHSKLMPSTFRPSSTQILVDCSTVAPTTTQKAEALAASVGAM